MRLNINRILASLALIMLACIFTMCKEYDEADRVEITYAFQENPVSIKMLDAFGHNIIYGDRLKVYSINGDGQDSSLNYMVKNHGEDQYVEYLPPLPQRHDTIKIGDKLTTNSFVSIIGNAVLVRSEFTVTCDSIFNDAIGHRTRKFIVSNSGNYICGVAVDGIAQVLNFLNENNKYWLVGKNGKVNLWIIFPSVDIEQNASKDLFSIDVKSADLQAGSFNYDAVSVRNNDGTSRVTVSVKANVNDYYEEGGRLLEPRELTFSLTSSDLLGNGKVLEIALSWNGNCFDPKFEDVRINDTPKEIAIKKDSSGIEYVTVTF